jgi:integrase
LNFSLCGLLHLEASAWALATNGAVSAELVQGGCAEEGQRLLDAVSTDTLRGKRDAAMLGLLLGCGLRRSEVANPEIEKIQRRDGHWAVVDLVGKAGHVRTVPAPLWVKTAIDGWISGAGINEGRLFRLITLT